MSVDIEVNSDVSEFKEGDEAGLDSPEETKSGEAGIESAEALKSAGEKKTPVDRRRFDESGVPLFLRDRSEGPKGNAQDEKDGASE